VTERVEWLLEQIRADEDALREAARSVLERCSAMRRIVMDCAQYRDESYAEAEDESAAATDYLSVRALNYLTEAYADRPGCKAEWRMDGSG
jgi:transposase-like protein